MCILDLVLCPELLVEPLGFPDFVLHLLLLA